MNPKCKPLKLLIKKHDYSILTKAEEESTDEEQSTDK